MKTDAVNLIDNLRSSLGCLVGMISLLPLSVWVKLEESESRSNGQRGEVCTSRMGGPLSVICPPIPKKRFSSGRGHGTACRLSVRPSEIRTPESRAYSRANTTSGEFHLMEHLACQGFWADIYPFRAVFGGSSIPSVSQRVSYTTTSPLNTSASICDKR